MYSGTSLKLLKPFDAWFGAHQKINRAARRNLSLALKQAGYYFPGGWEICKFEGIDGPDGIKRKTPAKDEPWHYIDPDDEADVQIVELIEAHYRQLCQALQINNHVRASFESAWLSHAIVDGLTPAHHYPYEKELSKLRGGAGLETRNSVRKKLLMPGETLPKRFGNNWKMWGDKGLLATHIAFEIGVATILAPLRLKAQPPDATALKRFQQAGIGKIFLEQVRTVSALTMYEQFYRSGWTPRLAKQVRRELLPLIVDTVALAWYGAVLESQKGVVK